MKLRVHGTPEECRQGVEALTGMFRVVSVSDAYPDRGASALVRVYLDIRLDDPPPAPVESWDPARAKGIDDALAVGVPIKTTRTTPRRRQR